MDFRDYASRETTALVHQLLARCAESSANQLGAVRDALDATARAVEAASRPSPAVEQGVEELVRRLATAAGAGVKAAAQRIQDEAQKAVDAAHAECDAQRSRAAQLSTLHAQLEAHVQALEADLRAERERADTADRDLDSALDAHRELEAALLEAQTLGRQAADGHASTERELQDTRALLEEALAESARLGGQLDREAADKATLSSDLFAAREELERLEAARACAEAAAKQEAEARLGTEEELNTVRSALDGAVSEAGRLQDEVRERTSAHASLHAELERLEEEVRQTRSELRTLGDENERLAAAHARLAAEHQSKLSELGSSLSERDRLAAARDAIAAERRAIAEQRDLLAAERDELADARAALSATVEESRRRLQAFEEEADGHRQRIAELQRALEDAVHDQDRERAPDASPPGEIRHGDERTAPLLSEALAAVDHISQATTVGDVLAALVRQTARRFPRVAVFRVKGNRLEGEHQVGFDQASDLAKLVLPMSVDSLPTRAATTGTTQRAGAGELADGRLTPLGPSSAAAIAIPVVVHGEPLAVLYAELAGNAAEVQESADAPNPVFATLLVRHTTLVLMQLTDELKALAALREYAAMLLQEAREMHAADTQAGRKPDEVRRRLEDTIDCARQLYAQRAALEGSSASGLFDEQIVAALELEAETPFALDLAAASRHDISPTLAGREAAEAS